MAHSHKNTHGNVTSYIFLSYIQVCMRVWLASNHIISLFDGNQKKNINKKKRKHKNARQKDLFLMRTNCFRFPCTDNRPVSGISPY